MLCYVSSQTPEVNSLAYDSQRGCVWAACGDWRTRAYDLATGKQIQALEGHKDYVHQVTVRLALFYIFVIALWLNTFSPSTMQRPIQDCLLNLASLYRDSLFRLQFLCLVSLIVKSLFVLYWYVSLTQLYCFDMHYQVRWTLLCSHVIYASVIVCIIAITWDEC